MKVKKRTVASYLPFLGIIIVIIFSLLALAHILSTKRKLRHASSAGRAISAKVSSVGMPLTTFNRYGNPGDPINMEICATDGQIGAAFASAGWYRADEIDFITSARISIDSILGRSYTTAPVSNLYLFGHKEDLAFERPGHTVRQRDHIRLWNTSRIGDSGRPIWIGSATKDVKVELSKTNHLPTHGIAPDLDDERNLVVSELAQTGFLIEDTTCPGFGEETHSFNGGGDPYFTDGQVAVLALANIKTSPLATQVRSPLGARIAKYVTSFLRFRLPEAGLNRAADEQARLTQSAQVG
jgi:LssY C-terminus